MVSICLSNHLTVRLCRAWRQNAFSLAGSLPWCWCEGDQSNVFMIVQTKEESPGCVNAIVCNIHNLSRLSIFCKKRHAVGAVGGRD